MALPSLTRQISPAGGHFLTNNLLSSLPRLSKSRVSLASKMDISASLDSWKEIIDPASLQPYYWNTETNETSWKRPTYRRMESPSDVETSNIGTKAVLTMQLLFSSRMYPRSLYGSFVHFGCWIWVYKSVGRVKLKGQESSAAMWLPLDELTSILLAAAAADPSRFGDVANHYRPQCFENEFFDHLADIINSSEDKIQREEYERLRARLANPLLKNPPPY